MKNDWSDKTACRLLNQGLIQKGICLLLGAADTDTVTIKAPQLDIRQARCIVIGDVSINTSDMSDYGYRFH